MSEQVIRHDIVQLDFDIGSSLKELKKLQDDINELKKKLLGGIENGAFDDLKDKANETIKPLDKVKQKTEEVTKKVTDLGKKAATTAFNGLKKLAGISFKALTVGLSGALVAAGGLVKNAVSEYADFEQLKGGVETLFKGSADTVIKYANNAYKTAGLSANQYMETVTGFSASLLQSVGNDTEKAAKLADMAISDMSDNANKMGTSMESIQYAYQGFAKQNYTMLDNLKLGYGGTKTEMERLVKNAAKLDKSVKANDMSYGNIVKAIHAVQVEMDIYGTTSKEASTTITGSLSAMKSAWGNLMPALIQGGDQFDQCIENLKESLLGVEDETGKRVGGVINNLKPAITKAISGVGDLITGFAPIIQEEFPKLVSELLPPLITAATSLLVGLIKALPSIVKTVAKEIPNILKELGQGIADTFGEQFPVLKKFGNFFTENAGKIAKFIPVILGLVAAFKIFNKIKSLSGIFGKGGDEKTDGLFSSLAKMKTTSVLKGMANLAIIIGGFTIIAAALMAVAPYMAQLTDFKSILKISAVLIVLGVVGTALAKFGSIAGKVPVSTVAKGLANMAIMIGGMSALFLLIGALSLIKSFDLGRITKIALIIGVLGTVGAVLSVFAGIVGIIPIPVVLAGLANMALVLGGVTALIVAFGALSKIEGFNEFITTGGDLLANVFGVIGKIGGSLIGGLGEGISNGLPAIGENLGKFGENIKPLFDNMKGIDMGGVGSFFTSLVGLLGIATGNEIVEGIKSFFGGGDDESALAKLGTQLTDFATNASGFFTKVSELPENGFSNATKMFECLGGLKNLPKEGGIKGWFSGELNYANIAAGLSDLSNEQVTGFFKTIAGLEQAGFDNATKLFDCLAGMKSLPKEGGVVGWFSGNVDYSKIAEGLGDLSSEGVTNFFAMVSGLNAQTFENTKLLFESLATIKDLPKEGGWWDKITGEETSTLSSIADELGGFAEKTATFFTQVNALNISKLNSLWTSLKKAGQLTTKNLSVVIDESMSSLVSKISGLPKKMGDALKNNSKGLSDGMVKMWKDAVKASVAPVNKLLDGANHILKEFGSKKKVITWTPYARGTGGHKGGNALVNDGNGAELIQMPNGHTFIPNGRNVLIPNAPKGMKVLPAGSTARLMGRRSPTFKYADGIGNIDIWSFIDNSSGLVNKISEGISYKGMSAFAANVGRGMVATFKGEMSAWVEKLFEEEGALGLKDYIASKGVSQWKSTVIRALKMEGQYSVANVARTLFQMQTESGGNPRAINLWDSNAKKGIPSKGLMQVIDPTFKAYAREGFNKNIYDPLSNILASVRYATSRYGSLANAYRGVGYSRGVGTVTLPKQSRSVNVSYTPESSYTGGRAHITENNTYSPVFNLTISGTSDDRATERKVKKWIREAWEEMISTFDSKNPQTQEV